MDAALDAATSTEGARALEDPLHFHSPRCKQQDVRLTHRARSMHRHHRRRMLSRNDVALTPNRR